MMMIIINDNLKFIVIRQKLITMIPLTVDSILLKHFEIRLVLNEFKHPNYMRMQLLVAHSNPS